MRTRLRDAFVTGYQRKFGRTPPQVAVELVTLRVSARAPVRQNALSRQNRTADSGGPPNTDRRSVFFPELGGFVDTVILRRAALPAGFSAAGSRPALV